MGLSQSCSCNCDETNKESLENKDKKETNDLIDKLLYGKMTLNNLLYYYDYDKTKVCLVKTKDLLDFFNSKTLLRLPNKKEINYYYDKIFLTNFLDFHETTFVFMEYSYKTSKDLKMIEKNQNSLNYLVEDISSSNICITDRITLSKHLYETIINDLKSKTKRNFIFVGLVKQIQDGAFCFKLIYKKNIRLDFEVFYEIFIFDGKISEESIKYILSENRFKNKLLKSIISYSADMFEQKYMLKNIKVKNKNKVINVTKNDNRQNSQKCYFFIFEENTQQTLEYDYLIVSLDSNQNSNENLLQDIARKLNDYQEEYKLSCVFSDDKKIYLILETSNTTNDSLLNLNSVDYKIS